jgi:3-deoxy-D-manno-octulosonate 8-phosphate phosphatase (KDO 8-P phosphatase)
VRRFITYLSFISRLTFYIPTPHYYQLLTRYLMSVDSCSSSKDGLSYPGDCEFTAFLRDRAAGRDLTIPRTKLWKQCYGKAKAIKLLLLDVDGVLTDGTITYSDNGQEIKSFNARDGFGINILRKIGVEVGIITARKSKALERRLKDLSLTHVYQGVRNKVRTFNEIINTIDIHPSEVAYMGDDWLDLSLLTKVGFAAAVADATPEVKVVVDYVAENGGGRGAVRELCDLIIEAQGKRQELLAEYLDRT